MNASEPDYSATTVLIVGAARSGIAAASFLLAHGAHVILTDSKDEKAIGPALAPLREATAEGGGLVLELGGHRRESFRNCDIVVVSPGVPLSMPLFAESHAAGIPVLAEVELAWRHIKGRVLGITGSNGKTTTTMLTAELLRGAGMRAWAAGNIGRPLINLAGSSLPEDLYAVELSSFQLEGIDRFRPFAGAILNLTPDHLDRYPDFDAYAAAKQRIFMNQSASDYAVLNSDDPRTAALAERVPSAAVLFSHRREVGCGTFLRGERLIFRNAEGETDICAVEDIRLYGNHNLENVLAACTLALLAGAPAEALAPAIRAFTGVEHRLESVAEIMGVRYFNDSKATNVDAAVKSLEAFPGNIIWIAGGRDKDGDFSPLRALAAQRVKHLIVIGEAAGKIREALADVIDTRPAVTLPEAVAAARDMAKPGDIVLLAPACASFDMFQNYEHRGRVFKEAVQELKRG